MWLDFLGRLARVESAGFTPNTQSLTLNGSTQWVNVGTGLNSILQYNEPFTISAWINPSSTTTQTIFGNMTTETLGNFGSGVSFNTAQSGGLPLLPLIGNGLSTNAAIFSYTATPTLVNGTWVLVTWTYSAATQTAADFVAYQNATSNTLTVGGTGPVNTISTADALIGSNNGGVSTYTPFAGNLSDVAVYNRVLTGTEVTALYGGGTPPNLNGLSSSSALVSWWRLNGDFTDSAGSNAGTGVGSPGFTSSVP